METGRVELEARGPFSLAQSVAFADSFAPAGTPQAEAAVLRLAFCDDGGTPVAIAARQDGPRVLVDYRSDLAANRVTAHVARILGLDVDATGFLAVAERDPVVADLQRAFPGRRPVCFGTPFEAAVWSVLSQRTSMRQAAAVRARLVEALGTAIELEGTALKAFPAPERVAALDGFSGLPEAKAERLRGLARAAQARELDPDVLRAADPEDALERLGRLPGVGPFSAQLILLRGAGHPDVLPLSAPRLAASVQEAYELPARPAAAEIQARAEAWRPFRSWVVFLLRNRFSGRAPPASGRA
jgi:3-methyladenine DNA glycosylase/8-oxoguanine DNA glycosylase